ncbi:MAG: hypothetical protein JWN85_3636 [Gammaproteobacteria bacterium]|nr:hypothetical protein [Gammaproteobacteria bacterium]
MHCLDPDHLPYATRKLERSCLIRVVTLAA